MKRANLLYIVKIGVLAALVLSICVFTKSYATYPSVSDDKTAIEISPPQNVQTLVLAGGCFWGVEAVFEHVKGVIDVVSGYAGGSANTATYNLVSSGETEHAEAVRVSYNSTQVSLDTLLDIYFTVAHNPTQFNYQGPDHGTQYRSAIFYTNDAQKKVAERKIATLEKDNHFPSPIVTKLERLDRFFPAEAHHQNYATLHPMQPYIIIHDAPKVKKLKENYPDLYKEEK